MNTMLRGIFLTAANPAATAKFYKEIAGLELEEIGAGGAYTYWKIDRDGLQLAIHDAKAFADYSHPVNSQSNVTHLYFKIESQPEFLQHLARLGLAPFRRDEIVVTVIDPDGRAVMFGTA
jgi:hypothetical protein